MKILVLTGPCYPRIGNNANLLSKIIQHLKNKCEVHILSCAFGEKELPREIKGVPVHWVTDFATSVKDRIVSKIVDRNGYSDYIQSVKLVCAANALRSSYPFDTVISTVEPFPCAYASSKIKNVKRLLYIMDPPAPLADNRGTEFRLNNLSELLAKQDCIFTTPFIKDALLNSGFNDFNDKINTVGFPMICDNPQKNTDLINMDSSRINLLFCGWLYSDIRSPKYFLDIVSGLDERFCIYFMGKECEKLRERFDFKTKARVFTMGQQPYDVALKAMEQADILINIGNSVPVHMPSKTLEYINTGKPFVNFYKIEDCPTLYFTKKYPLCLNIYEKDADINKSTEIFKNFCISKKGCTVDREYILNNYAECTPEYIANKMIKRLEEYNG